MNSTLHIFVINLIDKSNPGTHFLATATLHLASARLPQATDLLEWSCDIFCFSNLVFVYFNIEILAQKALKNGQNSFFLAKSKQFFEVRNYSLK